MPAITNRGDGAKLAFLPGMVTSPLRPEPGSLVRRVAVALTLAGALACSIERPAPADTASAAGEIVSVRDSAPAAPVDSATFARDTMVPTPTPAPAPAPAADRDTTSVVASPAELDALRAALAIPVQGVAAGALHDSYDEARVGHSHQALDILAPRGTPVLAATDGRVLKLHDSAAGGLMVYQADASDRFILMYGHLDGYAPGLADGAPLRRGQLIGYVGTTGNAPPGTPHLHFVVARGRPSVSWWKGTPVNPYPLLKR